MTELQIKIDTFVDEAYEAFDHDNDAYQEWYNRFNALSDEAKAQLMGFRQQGLSVKSAISMVA